MPVGNQFQDVHISQVPVTVYVPAEAGEAPAAARKQTATSRPQILRCLAPLPRIAGSHIADDDRYTENLVYR